MKKTIKIIPRYGSHVIVVPVPSESSTWKDASREELSVLLVLMSGRSFPIAELAELSGVTEEEAEDAVRHWSSLGLFEYDEIDEAQTENEFLTESVTKKYLSSSDSLPNYNTDETARFLEHNRKVKHLLDACQRIMGKIFNTADSNIVIGLIDYLSLSPEYVRLLVSWCADNDRKSMRYVEKLALGLHDDGVVSYDQLDSHLRSLTAARSAEGELRKMLGIGARALTSRETKTFRKWTGEWAFPMDVIRFAYEITADKTGSASLQFMNSILEGWHSAGVKTLEDARKAEEERKVSPAGSQNASSAGSFDTDEFFTAALKRSYGTAASETNQ